MNVTAQDLYSGDVPVYSIEDAKALAAALNDVEDTALTYVVYVAESPECAGIAVYDQSGAYAGDWRF